MNRSGTRRIRVGAVAVGGGAPVSVQSMTKTDTRDVAATSAQIERLKDRGCDIVRVAVADAAAAEAFGELAARSTVPLVADVHFDHRLAVAAVARGAAGLRINPGNIGGRDRVAEVVAAARDRGVPIRIGVNGGSLEKDILAAHGGPTPAALVESALRHAAMVEACGYREVKISVKAADVRGTIDAYRLLSARTDYPLHVGLTEAGTAFAGTVRSCVAMGVLLAEGIGDTIRVSLTAPPEEEVRVGIELLRSLGLRPPGPHVISCPTCGRTEIDVAGLAARIEAELEAHYLAHPGAPRLAVAVMGCAVNGPGEARQADVAIAGGKGLAALYRRGRHVRTVPDAEAVAALMGLVREWEGG